MSQQEVLADRGPSGRGGYSTDNEIAGRGTIFLIEMKAKGFPGQCGVVSQWAQRRRLAEKAGQSGFARTPSSRVIARLMTAARDDLAKSEAILVAAIEVNVPELVAARKAIGDFQSMIRSKSAAKLEG